jgi:chromosome segregation ATPase
MAKTCQACGGAVCEICGGCVAHGECSCVEDQIRGLKDTIVSREAVIEVQKTMIENANVEIASLRAERDQAIEEARQHSARCDELFREVEQWQADRNVLQGQIERLTKSQVVMAQHLHETQTALVCAEDAIRAMWQVFASAMAYSEHGRSSELNGLRKLAEEFRTNPPAGIMDIILGVVDDEQAQR